jgi:hypothetical protein
MNPISMGRRSFVRGASLATVAIALPGTANAVGSPASAYVQSAIQHMVAVFEAETDAYLAGDSLPDEVANEATNRAAEAADAVLDLPKEQAFASPDYVPALALIRRRWLVMEGSYDKRHDRDECLLVGAVLAVHRFNNVRLLWHIRGESRASRPGDAEFQAGWELRS